MALFGRSRRANTVPTIPLMTELRTGKAEEPKQAGTQAVRSRGGLFGAFMPKSMPRTLQVIGATMRQMGDPSDQALDAFNANEAEQMRLAAVDAAAARQSKLGEQQTAQLEQAIATLPPEQQAWARLNPEAFMRAYVQSQMDQRNSGWNVGQGYSHAFRVDPSGRVVQGDALPLRPRAPVQGYMWPDNDGTVYSDELPEGLR